MKLIFRFFLIFPFFIAACNSGSDRTRVDVSDLQITPVIIHRYDEALFRVNSANLSQDLMKISSEFPFFLGTDLNDPSNLASMKEYLENPRNQDFSQAVSKKFVSLQQIENDLTDAFRHVKHYYPEFRIPRVYSYISGGDYDNPIRLVDSVMIIALDCYLGKDYQPYLEDGVPVYKTERMIPEQIVPDCMRAVANQIFPQDPANLTLLELMVEAGKQKYLVQSFMPELRGDLLMKYPGNHYEWASENEVHVWAAIIDNKMLYSTEGKTLRMFMADGPFTPEFSKASPPRLGEWIGYQIVRSFMNENDEVSLTDMLAQKDAQRLLQLSGYKPEK